MQDSNYYEYFDYLIKKYLKRYDVITKKSINDILAVHNDLHLIKIIDGKLLPTGVYMYRIRPNAYYPDVVGSLTIIR